MIYDGIAIDEKINWPINVHCYIMVAVLSGVQFVRKQTRVKCNFHFIIFILKSDRRHTSCIPLRDSSPSNVRMFIQCSFKMSKNIEPAYA